MAIELKFDVNKQLIAPTFVLTKRNGDKINLINNIDETSIRVSDGLNEATEVSFVVYKTDLTTGTDCLVWDELQDFKLVYCLDWNTFLEMSVVVNEENGAQSKNITLKHLPECELSRINVYKLEINTEQDTDRTDEERPATIIYNPQNTEFSLLHRLFENAPHYNIEGCDSSLQTRVRNFSWDSKDIKSCLDELCTELQAIVEYKAYINGNGEMIRGIYLHDLLSSCHNPQCSYLADNKQVYRGEFLDKCPECNSDLIQEGYGEDTSIFITEDGIGDEIHYENNKDQTKNCFRLVAGDDLMTETIANCNPNGGKYLWCWSDKFVNDMSDELRSKLVDTTNPNSYQSIYHKYIQDYTIDFTIPNYRSKITNKYYLPKGFCDNYNALVNKYNAYRDQNEQFLLLPSSYLVEGYATITKYLYDFIDLSWFIRSSMYPTWNHGGDTTASQQCSTLVANISNTVAVAENTTIGLTTSNSAVLNLAKLIVDNRYKVTIQSSSLNSNTNVWSGSFKIVNYSDSDDNATTSTINITINHDFEKYVKQTLKNKLDDFANKNDKYDITGLFEQNLTNFTASLEYYSLDALKRFNDCCQGLIDVLLEKGTSSVASQEFNALYQEYLSKSSAISNAVAGRESDLYKIIGKYYDYEFGVSDSATTDTEVQYELKQLDSANDMQYGLYRYINDDLTSIKAELNLQTFLGDTLYKELCSYKCEDIYKNENYKSEGIENNADLFKLAERFLEKAREDIFKSANSQHKITAKLKNLLVIQEFSPLVEYFKTGNWIRVKIDDKIYRLRLLNYDINFGNIEDLDVDFAEITETTDGFSDIKKILDKANSMSSSYSFVHQQAYHAEESKNQINDWFQNGLDITHTKLISNADNQDQVWDSHGMLFRKYLPELNDYDKEQFKIINHTIAMTTDGWQSTKVALGKFIYQDPSDNTLKYGYGINGETVIGKLILGTTLGIYNGDNSLKFDNNGLTVSNGVNKVSINPNASNNSVFTISKIVNNQESNLLYFDTTNNRLSLTGNIHATSGTIAGFDIIGTSGSTKLSSDGIEIFTSPMSYPDSQTTTIGGIILKNTLQANNQYSTVMYNSFNVFYTETDEVLGQVKYNSSIHSRGVGVSKTIVSTGERTSSNIFPEGSALFSHGLYHSTTISGGHIDAVSFDMLDRDDANYDYYLQTSPTEISIFQTYWEHKDPYSGTPQVTSKLRIKCSSSENSIISYIPIQIQSTLEVWKQNNAFISCVADGYSSGTDAYTANISVANEHQEGKIHVSAAGNFGLWSTTFHKWLVKMNLSGNMTLLGDQIRLDTTSGDNYLRPSANNGAYLGSANLRWHTVYVGTGGFNSSDRKLKDHIEYLEDDNNLEDFIMGLKPMMYTFKDGEGHRHHMGFYAQDVSENAHQTIGDIAAYQAVVLDVDKDGNIIERYYDEEADDKDLAWVLNYNELLAPVVAMLQKVNRENKAMREELNQLKNNNQEV